MYILMFLNLVCPYCGEKREVYYGQSLTYRCRHRSDQKKYANVLTVAKCPCCKRYYLLSRQEVDDTSRNGHFRFFKNKSCLDLSYNDLKKAWAMLRTMPDLTKHEKFDLLSMQVWAFNDRILDIFSEEESPLFNPKVPKKERA